MGWRSSPSPLGERVGVKGAITRATNQDGRMQTHRPIIPGYMTQTPRHDRIERARGLRRNQTAAERLLWSKLRSRQLIGLKFRRQHPIGGYVADFVCVEARLLVELDGGQHAVQKRRDAERDARLANMGYRTLRFWNNEIFENLEGVLAVIAETVRAGTSGED